MGATVLNGLRVIDFGQFIAAPSAAQTLADLGAEVIKVEPPGGDASRRSGWQKDNFGPMFSANNRGKRSIVLDLRNLDDRNAALQLVLTADVVIQNARPGVMEKFGLGADQLRESHPRLVYGSVSGFGDFGPAALRPGLDIAAQAESGMMSINGDADADPTRIGFTVVDVLAGKSLATGILAALLQRTITGKGSHVKVSLIDAAADAMSQQWAEHQMLDSSPTRCGNGQATLAPAADVIHTAKGMVVLSAYVQEHFARLCACVGRQDLISDHRFRDNASRVKNRVVLRKILSDAFSEIDAEETCAKLTSAGVVCGVIRDVGDAMLFVEKSDPDKVLSVSSSSGRRLKMPAAPISIEKSVAVGNTIPELGEHTEEVLALLKDSSLPLAR
jgi:crotonobetainyl-CoA:carnitine CoA-transferase CaiB-like acyl-CoA transferase